MGKPMNLEQRIRIKEMLDSGHSISDIANSLKYNHVTIYKEIKRCDSREEYNPYYAQSLCEKSIKNRGRVGKLSDMELAKYISDLILIKHLSPEKIVALLKKDNRGFSDVPRSANTIYSAIDKGLIPGVTRETLLTNISTVFQNGHICIPKWVLDKLNIKNGDELLLEVTEDNKIIYKKVEE